MLTQAVATIARCGNYCVSRRDLHTTSAATSSTTSAPESPPVEQPPPPSSCRFPDGGGWFGSMVGSPVVASDDVPPRSGAPAPPSWHARSPFNASRALDEPTHTYVAVVRSSPSGTSVVHGIA